MAAHFDVNVILVGSDYFSAAQRQQVNDALTVMTSIFAPLGPTVGTIGRFEIGAADSKGLYILLDEADANSLTDHWAVNNDAIDMFVVMHWGTASGMSPRPGKCPKLTRKILRSPVVSLDGVTKEFNGNTFAHEIGHFLGLPHAERDTSLVGPALVAANFMKEDPGSNTEVTLAQAEKMKSHCSIKF
jgi:hypothetical protein